ncbi:MAG: hypothetical protein ABR991_09205, partial [Terracidiphilus sp.]
LPDLYVCELNHRKGSLLRTISLCRIARISSNNTCECVKVVLRAELAQRLLSAPFPLQTGVLGARIPVAELEIADCQYGLIGTAIVFSVNSTGVWLTLDLSMKIGCPILRALCEEWEITKHDH